MIRTISQNNRLYKLFSELGITGDVKADMVLQFTGDRTERSSEMEYNECNNLICTLDDELYKQAKQRQGTVNRQERINNDVMQGLRRKIFSLMYDIGFISKEQTKERRNYVVNSWVVKKTKTGKTNINQLKFEELNLVIKQLRAVNRIYKEKAKLQSQLN